MNQCPVIYFWCQPVSDKYCTSLRRHQDDLRVKWGVCVDFSSGGDNHTNRSKKQIIFLDLWHISGPNRIYILYCIREYFSFSIGEPQLPDNLDLRDDPGSLLRPVRFARMNYWCLKRDPPLPFLPQPNPVQNPQSDLPIRSDLSYLTDLPEIQPEPQLIPK